jgi:hypothetical protein
MRSGGQALARERCVMRFAGKPYPAKSASLDSARSHSPAAGALKATPVVLAIAILSLALGVGRTRPSSRSSTACC